METISRSEALRDTKAYKGNRDRFREYLNHERAKVERTVGSLSTARSKILKVRTSNRIDAESVNVDGGTAFYPVAILRDLATIKSLFDAGDELITAENRNRKPIYLAYHHNYADLVKLLLELTTNTKYRVYTGVELSQY